MQQQTGCSMLDLKQLEQRHSHAQQLCLTQLASTSQAAGRVLRNKIEWKEIKTMTKIQKTGPDGKLHYYWHFSEAELAKMREKREEQKKQEQNTNNQ